MRPESRSSSIRPDQAHAFLRQVITDSGQATDAVQRAHQAVAARPAGVEHGGAYHRALEASPAAKPMHDEGRTVALSGRAPDSATSFAVQQQCPSSGSLGKGGQFGVDGGDVAARAGPDPDPARRYSLIARPVD